MKKIVIANWKMNKTIQDSLEFLKSLKESSEVEIVIAPDFVSLYEVRKALEGSTTVVAAQNMYFEEKGAFTGEISPLMLNSINCDYVILGHSERRVVNGEGNELINKKINSALSHNLKVVFCFGENIEQRRAGQAEEVVEEQLNKGLSNVESIGDIVFAYEPVWAIGTGVTPTTEEIADIHKFIRESLTKKFGDKANQVRIIYGGSVKPENAKDFGSLPNVDGFIVGGASLDPESFNQIVANV